MKPTLMILIALFSFTALAQPPQKMKRDRQTDMSIEERASITSKKMTLALDLNENQQAEIEKVLINHLTIQKEKREKREGKTSEELATDAVERKEARLDSKIALQNEMKKILTPEQFEDFQKLQRKRESRKKGRKERY